MSVKSDLIDKVAGKYSHLNRSVIVSIFDKLLENFSCALKDHNRIELRGFGAFSVKSFNVKNVHSTGLNLILKNKYFRVHFRSSASLLDAIDDSKNHRNTDTQ